MSFDVLLFVLAGFVGGIVNAAAGGAKLFVFPLLLASGLPPLVANATATVALWPSQAPAIFVYRDQLRDDIGRTLRRLLPALAGSLAGALTLVHSSDDAFTAAIPVVLAIAVAAILIGPRAGDWMQRVIPARRLHASSAVLLFGTGFYGGFFGAGLGFMLIAILTVGGIVELQRANAFKNFFAFSINTTAVLPFALSGLVDWLAALGVLLGGLAGGYAGAHVSRCLPEHWLRWCVAILGVILTASFLVR